MTAASTRKTKKTSTRKTKKTMRITTDAPHVVPLPREIWRAAPGRERRFSVSSRGRVFDHARRCLIDPGRARIGVASAVATAFLGPAPRGKVAARIDPDEPVSAKNLVWSSPADLPRPARKLAASLPTGNPLADKLAAVRVAAGLTQAVLGDAVGLTGSQVERIEQGRTRPRGALIQRWLTVCGADDEPVDVLGLMPAEVVLCGAELARESRRPRFP